MLDIRLACLKEDVRNMFKIMTLLIALALSACDQYQDTIQSYVSCDSSERGSLAGNKEIGFIVTDNPNVSYCVTRTYFDVGDTSYQSAYIIEIFNKGRNFERIKLGIIYPELAELGLREQNLDGKLIGNRLMYILDIPPTDNKGYIVYFRMEVKPTSMQKKDDTVVMPVIIYQ